MKKSEKEENNNDNKDKNLDIKEENSKKEIKSNNEEPIKNEDIKNSIKDYNKIEDSKNEITPEKNDNYTKIFYVSKPELLSSYHVSLDNREKNNIISNSVVKNIKMRKTTPPINIDRKTLLKQIRKVNKSQFNEFRENKNY